MSNPVAEAAAPATPQSRNGTLSSSTFALLTTMIGGGTLSLPLAFAQSGAIGGSLILLFVASSAYGSIMKLIDCSSKTSHDSYETVVSSAPVFRGSSVVKYFCMGSLAMICWTGVVGYCVLLRDLAGRPMAELLFPEDSTSDDESSSPTFHQNAIMLAIVALVTPLTMLRTLSSLQKVSMFGITSISLLGMCIIYKSVECNFSLTDNSIRLHGSFSQFLLNQLWPHDWKQFLDALPIFVGPYMCHFNVLPVYNELVEPSRDRIRYIIRFATVFATFFYIVVGISGSLYGNCVESGEVEGNILLNFDDKHDGLMSFGKGCLTMTIALALPVMVIPCRDTLMRMFSVLDAIEQVQNDNSNDKFKLGNTINDDETISTSFSGDYMSSGNESYLSEPLLNIGDDTKTGVSNYSIKLQTDNSQAVISLVIFWGAALLACLVESVDTVWEISGSTLVILIGFIAPCFSFLSHHTNDVVDTKLRLRLLWGKVIICCFIPVMIACSSNAVYNIIWAINQ